MSETDKLVRSTDDSLIAGVCSGLSEHFQLDVTLVRSVFVALTVVGGFGPALYVVLWFMLDDNNSSPDVSDQAVVQHGEPIDLDAEPEAFVADEPAGNDTTSGGQTALATQGWPAGRSTHV